MITLLVLAGGERRGVVEVAGKGEGEGEGRRRVEVEQVEFMAAEYNNAYEFV